MEPGEVEEKGDLCGTTRNDETREEASVSRRRTLTKRGSNNKEKQE